MPKRLYNFFYLVSKNKVLLTGCGTSGRLAFFCSRQFNRVLCEMNLFPSFDYLMAGGDEALFVSQELAEDQPQLGAADLQATNLQIKIYQKL